MLKTENGVDPLAYRDFQPDNLRLRAIQWDVADAELGVNWPRQYGDTAHCTTTS